MARQGGSLIYASAFFCLCSSARARTHPIVPLRNERTSTCALDYGPTPALFRTQAPAPAAPAHRHPRVHDPIVPKTWSRHVGRARQLTLSFFVMQFTALTFRDKFGSTVTACTERCASTQRKAAARLPSISGIFTGIVPTKRARSSIFRRQFTTYRRPIEATAPQPTSDPSTIPRTL